MRGALPFLVVLVLNGIAVASDPNEVGRSTPEVFKLLQPTKAQAAALHKIDAKFDAQLAKLRKAGASDYSIKRDTLNDKYTHDFLGAMTPEQKSAYRKFVRTLRQTYMKAHPDVDPDNVFIWGGANIL